MNPRSTVSFLDIVDHGMYLEQFNMAQNYFPSKARLHAHENEGFILTITPKEIQEIFQYFDEGQKGYLNKHECKCATVALLGKTPNPQEIIDLLGEEQYIILEQFTEFIKRKLKITVQIDRKFIMDAYSQFDTCGKGYISIKDCESVFKQVLEHIQLCDIHRAFCVADLDQDGQVTYQEFLQFMSGQSLKAFK
eukprot:TRINITY_DN41190_c0_g1_i2.p1 TRINITY_DN41190_c0_g1~~TRINITY_DN41190_c0_g1_i2.p1  ORF type:complete len:193 (-),score=9.14 TRINITY_DN41190_c0_g1_i2:2-580(-)